MENKSMNSEIAKYETMGKYIKFKRSTKLKITQEQLAEMLGVSSNQISKWERGVREPDIDYMRELCKIFDVSIYELLEGKDLKENYDPRDYDEIVFKGFKFYLSKVTKKIITISLLVVLIIIIIFVGIMFLFNVYKWRLYNFDIKYNDYKVHGYVVTNKNESIYNINNILYESDNINTEKEPIVKDLKITLILDNDELYSYEIENDKLIPIHYCLRNLRVELNQKDEKIYRKNKELYILLEYHNKDNKIEKIKIPMQ